MSDKEFAQHLHVVEEVVATEAAYVADLGLIVGTYVVPMASLLSPDGPWLCAVCVVLSPRTSAMPLAVCEEPARGCYQQHPSTSILRLYCLPPLPTDALAFITGQSTRRSSTIWRTYSCSTAVSTRRWLPPRRPTRHSPPTLSAAPSLTPPTTSCLSTPTLVGVAEEGAVRVSFFFFFFGFGFGFLESPILSSCLCCEQRFACRFS